MLSADRDADNQVAHHVEDAVVAEIGARTEKAGAVSEIEFGAEDAGSHRASGHAEARFSVVEDVVSFEAGAAIGRDPGTDVAISSRHSRRTYERSGRHHDADFE